MLSKGKLLALLLMFVYITACHTATPYPNWNDFDHDHIDKKLSTKGPFGNYQIVFLKNVRGSNNNRKLVSFAVSQGVEVISNRKN